MMAADLTIYIEEDAIILEGEDLALKQISRADPHGAVSWGRVGAVKPWLARTV